MRFAAFLINFMGALSATFAQSQPNYADQLTRERINYANQNNVNLTSNTFTLFTIKGEPGKLLGDPYLDTTWQAGNVRFYNKVGTSLTTDSIAGVPVRLDLVANEVEIRAGATDIRAVKATAVRYVDVNNRLGTVSRFVNVHDYQGDADKLTGFFEQFVTGKVDLLQHPSVHILKANYNVAMNVGTKDDELVKKMDWYVAWNKKAVKFSPGKKAVLELMADKKDQIETFLKTEKPDLKSRSGLMAVFSYYNSL
ncbi:hypothetical protein [Spirosoma areae]